MSVKKINEEIIPRVISTAKKVPSKPKPLGLTLADFKKMIKDLPDDTILVCPGMDHSFTVPEVKKSTALFTSKEITEDYGEELTPESVYGKRKQVLIIS